MIPSKARRIPPVLNRARPTSGIAFNVTATTNGVMTADRSGKSAVNPAANAKSARAMRAKTGTTGANGAAASNIIPMEIFDSIPKALVAATASAGTTMKFTATMSVNRHFRSDAITSQKVNLRPTPNNKPDKEQMVSPRIIVSVFIRKVRRSEVLLNRIPIL